MSLFLDTQKYRQNKYADRQKDKETDAGHEN